MELIYETIIAATKGDTRAIAEVLNAYEPYINTLATFACRNYDANERPYLQQDAKQMLQNKLIGKLPKWKVLIK